MTEETKSSASTVEEAAQIHEDVAETAIKDTIETFLPGGSEPSKSEDSDKGDEKGKD